MSTARLVTRIGMLGAAAFALMYAEVRLPFFPAYLKYDAGDVPALIGTFAMGPAAGIAVEAVKALLFIVSGRAESGLIGVSANFAAGATLAFGAGAVYQQFRTKAGAVAALAAGSLAMAAVMSALNYAVFLPLWGVPREALASTVTGVILPFNLTKSGLSSLVTFLVYKRVRVLLGAEAAAWEAPARSAS